MATRHKQTTMTARADVTAVAEVMGHADPTMLLRVYQHTRYRLKKKAVNAAPGLRLDKI